MSRTSIGLTVLVLFGTVALAYVKLPLTLFVNSSPATTSATSKTQATTSAIATETPLATTTVPEIVPPAPTVTTSGFTTYRDEVLGLALRYPNDWAVSKKKLSLHDIALAPVNQVAAEPIVMAIISKSVGEEMLTNVETEGMELQETQLSGTAAHIFRSNSGGRSYVNYLILMHDAYWLHLSGGMEHQDTLTSLVDSIVIDVPDTKRIFGWIRDLNNSQGRYTMEFDDGQFYYGEEATKAATEAGFCESTRNYPGCPPDDIWQTNESTSTVAYAIAPDVDLQLIFNLTGTAETPPPNLDDYVEIFHGRYYPGYYGNGSHLPVYVFVKDGVVLRIAEQYVP